MISIYFLVPSTLVLFKKICLGSRVDERIVLDAYDSGSMITYEEVDVDEEDLSGLDDQIRKKRLIFLCFISFYLLCRF